MRLGTHQEAGFTFAELAFGMLILVICSVVLINHLAVNFQTTAGERDRVFAFSKAQAILAEIQTYVDRGQLEAVDLDVLDDGVSNKNTLSIQEATPGVLIAPDHVVSGNMQRNSQWLWSRRITVQPFAGINNRNVRYVTVRVYKKDTQGTDRPMADLSAVVNSSGDAFPATQVYDIYLLAVENIPGWWVFMDSLKPFMESMIMDVQTRNPGLEYRTHWITKASFGRNQLYRPYTNDATDSYAAIPDVYHYPGRMPSGSASAYYYVPDNMRARVNVDGTERNGYEPTLNKRPYALADFFNHAMRYPEEKALWDARVADVQAKEAEIAAALAASMAPPDKLTDMSKEPTLRLFLEDLNTNPAKYKNALVLNLHGELLPMPALRNYSDPAKSQSAYPNLRVVTHPEELRTIRDPVGGTTADLRFRMYAFGYRTGSSPYSWYTPVMNDPMVVEFVGVNLTDPMDGAKLAPSHLLESCPGGVLVGTSSDYTGWQSAVHATASATANEMNYRAEWVPPSGGADGFTRVYLFNTPTACPPDSMNRGLPNSERGRLYQMEYIPCPLVPSGGVPSFDAMDLTSTNATSPKNTARWRLKIDKAVLTDGSFVNTSGASYNPTTDVVLTVRTRIATGFSGGSSAWQSSGTVWPTPDDPDNLSTTYAWWADNKDDVPITERYQFNGDPRHLPYKDCFVGGDDFPEAFNWYHDNFNQGNTSSASSEPSYQDYPTIAVGVIASSKLRNNWNSGSPMKCDVPRYMQVLREGLVKSRCLYNSITGWSNYYLGIGNDIGYDSANGYPNSIPSNMVPHGTTGNGWINTIQTSATAGRRYVRDTTSGSGYWWGMPWLGELVPDSAVTSQWLDTASGTLPVRGNLPAGNSGATFYQALASTAYASSDRTAYGTTLANAGQRTATYGCTTFFNIGSSASTFQHSSSATNGTLTAVGNELANNYNTIVPASAPVSRPFRLNANVGAAVGEHWNYAPYTTRYSGTLFKQYYSHAAGSGSAVVKLVDNTNTNAGYIVVNGISNTVDNGTSFISRFALLALTHSMFEAGSTTNTLRINQMPRMEIQSPTDTTELEDPATIPVQYGVTWVRWDGLPYSGTGTFSESESQLEYVIHYSRNGGASWLHVQDDTPSTPGERPSDPAYLLADAGGGAEQYDWSVPAASFPEGTYQLRVDCFRQGAQVHYSYHMTSMFIQR